MAPARRRTHLTLASAALPLILAVVGLAWLVQLTQPGKRHVSEQAAARLAATAVPVVEPPKFDDEGLALPKKLGSLRFAVMGDVGRGDVPQYETAAEMARWRERFDFSFVLMLGDNMYGTGTEEDFATRFERPYKTLLDDGVEFYAANGNHDPPSILNYGPYNMKGNRYYAFTKTEGPLGPVAARTVRFFALDTVNLDAGQLAWLRSELAASDTDWEICFYHHPLYTSGRYAQDASRVRSVLEPVLVQYGAHVGLAGHEHFYERVIPQRGVLYFTSGAGGALRINDIRPSRLTAAGFDTDTHFLLMEISGDELFFQAISRAGRTVDAGRVRKLERPRPPPSLRR